MAAEPRIQDIMDLTDEIISILGDIRADMKKYIEGEEIKKLPNDQKIAFYQSQIDRTINLTDILEEDVITSLIGLSNISGPIKYLKEDE